jgi:uncharacterized protein
MPDRIWVDADSCPVKIREIIVRGAVRKNSTAFFCANRKIPIPENSHAKMIITTHSDADTYIIGKVKAGELVITRDIPLAAKLLEKGAIVINDRGFVFDDDSIREKLSVRNFSYELRANGLYKANDNEFSVKDIRLFSSKFDTVLNRFYTC